MVGAAVEVLLPGPVVLEGYELVEVGASMMIAKEAAAIDRVRVCALEMLRMSQISLPTVEACVMCSSLASGIRPISGCLY